MKKFLPFLIPSIIFLLLKIGSNGVRFSDTNIYFYTAFQMLQGKILYKDIFFTNFPLFMYISSLYELITSGNIYLYYFTAVLESVAVGFMIYLIVLRNTKRIEVALFSSSTYLFSYLILATSDHQSGVFLASLFGVFSYFFYERRRYFLTGAFVALAILSKAYFLPIMIAYLFSLKIDRISFKNQHVLFVAGGTIIASIFLLPTIIYAYSDFFEQIVSYSLIRPQGVSKTLIFQALLSREFFLFGISIVSIFFVKKMRFFSVLSVAMIFFFILYKDFYFYYFNISAPFMCIFLGTLYIYVERKMSLQKAILPTIFIIIFSINLYQYFTTSRNQKIDNFEMIVDEIKKINPPVIYGVNDIAPVLAYKTDKPLLGGIIDTNPSIYRKGFLSSSQMTKDAVSQDALLIGHGVEYPEYQIKQDMIDEIFDRSQISQCELRVNIPIKTEGYINRLQFLSCIKK